MQKLSQQMLKEFQWLTLSLAFTSLLAILLFGWSFLKSEVANWLPLMLLFFVVTFSIHLFKGFWKETRSAH